MGALSLAVNVASKKIPLSRFSLDKWPALDTPDASDYFSKIGDELRDKYERKKEDVLSVGHEGGS
jgi:hypothetical protein